MSADQIVAAVLAVYVVAAGIVSRRHTLSPEIRRRAALDALARTHRRVVTA